MKKTFKFMFSLMVSFFAFLLGSANGIVMADATALPDAGKTEAGNPGETTGVATETDGRENGDPEFYTKEIDQKITKIRPMATPIDQISRYATAGKSGSFEVKYYSLGTRPISCKTNATMEAQMSGASVDLEVEDPNMFTLDDTIRVVGVKGITGPDGQAYGETNKPDLVLCVCGLNTVNSKPIVYAVNGNKASTAANQPIWIPRIESGTTLVRMGKACGELDAQTGMFNNLPTAEIQYCQNFMVQVEQSFLDKIADKEVEWNFSDIEEDSIYDMRITQENSFLFGARQKIQHVTKKNMLQWFTGGIWFMAGKDVEVGHWDKVGKKCVISDEDLVDISKDLFVGTGIGNKRKVIFAGSEMLSALSKIKSDKFRLKENVEHWNLKFKSWETDFGELLVMHHELFDINGMSDCGFALDPEFLKKKTHLSWSRSILDLKSAGIRNTEGVVLQEISCLYLTYPTAHARLKLAGAGE